MVHLVPGRVPDGTCGFVVFNQKLRFPFAEPAVTKPKSAFSALMYDGDHCDTAEPGPEAKSKPKTGFSALADSDDDDANVVKPEDYPDSDDEKVRDATSSRTLRENLSRFSDILL